MKKILVIKHGSLGDIIFSISSMNSIKLKYKNASIHLLTEKKHSLFLSKFGIFEKIICDDRKFFFIYTLINLFKLNSNKYDVIIDLQNSDRTAIYNLFFRIFSKSKLCSSRPFSHLQYKIPNQGVETAKKGLSNQLELLNIQTFDFQSYNFLEVDLKKELPKPYVVFIPGVSKGNEYKQWQPDKFAKIAKYCELKNYNICVIGTKMDFESVKPIIESCKNVINKLDSSPPEIIYSIANKSSLIITNDTGPGHVSSLSNKNIIWMLNDNSISKANVENITTNHKIISKSLKSISHEKVIEYIEKNKLL